MDISERAAKLAAAAPKAGPRCATGCPMLLVVLSDAKRVWRCESCGHEVRTDGSSGQGSLFG